MTWTQLLAALRKAASDANGVNAQGAPRLTNGNAAAVILFARAAEQLKAMEGIVVGRDGQFDWYHYALPALDWQSFPDRFIMTAAHQKKLYADYLTNVLWVSVAAIAVQLDAAHVPVKALGTPTDSAIAYKQLAAAAYQRMKLEHPEWADPFGAPAHKPPKKSPPKDVAPPPRVPTYPPPEPTVAPAPGPVTSPDAPPPPPVVAIAPPSSPPPNSPVAQGVSPETPAPSPPPRRPQRTPAPSAPPVFESFPSDPDSAPPDPAFATPPMPSDDGVDDADAQRWGRKPKKPDPQPQPDSGGSGALVVGIVVAAALLSD